MLRGEKTQSSLENNVRVRFLDKMCLPFMLKTCRLALLLQTKRDNLPKSSVTKRPELVDDFVRNFLVRMNMRRTLDCFQTEWQVLFHDVT